LQLSYFFRNEPKTSYTLRLSKHHILIKLIVTYILFLFGTIIVSGQAPSANFTGSPLTGCSPLIVVFQDQSTGNPTSWSWDFGNGNTSTLQNPTATYFTPGTYTVSLTATNASGANTLLRTQYVTVYEPPVVGFSADFTSGCFPLRVQFTDLSTPGIGNTNVSWQWDFGNGTTSTLQNPFVTYSTAGNFTVTLRVTNDRGCTKTISRPGYITVTPGVTSAFSNSQPTVCNAPASISFTNNSTGPPTLSYLWDFGDGNFSTAFSPTHIYTGTGTFIATLVTFSTAGCQDTARSAPIVIGGNTTSFSSPPAACINETVSFINTSVPAPVSSIWTFGDGGTASTINAAYSYAATGTYTVRLYNNYGNCTDSVLNTITINPRPVANFSAPVVTKCEPPLTVNFQDLSSGGAVSWQWDFGDGSPPDFTQNPSHTYTAYGSFTVTLIAANAFGCTDTIAIPDYIIIRRATISIPSLPVRGCIPYTISPVPTINSVDAVTSYLWDFGDGGTSTLVNPTYTYNTQGTYTVKLFITTSSGCTDSLVIPTAVRVGSKPVADFSATPIPVCGRQPVTFTDLSVPADEWLWDFGDGGTSIIQNPVYNYNDTGYFTIQLIATNNGCADTMTKVDYVRVLPPIARFTPIPDCNNRLRFTFTDQSIAPLTWEWDFGDGSPLVYTQNPTHTFPTFGSYNVRLIVTNGGCADTLIQTIQTVNEIPDFAASITVDCKIGYIDFVASNVNTANIVSYNWDFGDGNNTTVPAPFIGHFYNLSGTYTVTLTVTDINGCTSSTVKPNYIRINGPTANFTATNTAGCAGGLTTTFNNLSTTDGVNSIVNWQWDFGDGTIQNFSAPPFLHTYNTAGIFSVKLIVTDASGCLDSLTQNNLITSTDPIPDFATADTLTCPGATVTFTNNSSPAPLTYQWEFGDGGTSTANAPTYSYAATGNYSVKLRVQDAVGCADSLIRNLYITVQNPVADFQVNDSISSCLPFEVRFTNTSTFYSSQTWDFGPLQGNSTLNNPTHYYSVAGTYPVKLIVTSPGGCVDSITKNIYVFDTVGSRVDYLPLNGCKPLTVNLSTFTTGPMASYYWDFGDGNILSTPTPTATHVYSSFGSFLPKIIMEDPSGCLIPLPGIDTVFVTGANTKFGIDDSLFCDFGTVNFTDSTTFNDPVLSYNWNFGDGGTSLLQNPVHLYSTPGLYTVQLSVVTQAGCRDTLTKPLVIKVVQRPMIDIGGDSVVCVNSSLLHSGLFIQPDTSVVNWQWNFPNGSTYIGQNPPVQTYTTAGTFTITTYATNSTGCRDTTTQTVYVNPLPVINLPAQMTIQSGFPVTIPATYSTNAISWLWSPAAGLSCTTCPTPDAGPKFDTRYQVYVQDDNGCTNIGAVLVIVICKNSNLFIPNTFSPNGDGSNDVFYPRGKGLERVKTLRIFNRWGEVVFEKRDFPVNDASAGWNGTFKGNKPQADVYVYQAEVFCENGSVITLNGNIALIL
jgi:gliding motility-associated-like protein